MKIQTPIDTKDTNTAVPNGEEWTEISLNNSPDEMYYNNEIYCDEEDQIPYKPLPMDLSPEGNNPPPTNGANIQSFGEESSRKKLITQKSLPAMPKGNEVSLSNEKKTEVTRSPSVKSKSKLDTSLTNWITRSSAGGEASAGSSGKYVRRDTLFLKI